MQLYHACTGRCRTNDDRSADEKHVRCNATQILIMITEALQTAFQALPLMEFFYTIQGEGYHQGKASYFIRLGGCDVGCTWCDVKESWDASAHPLRTVSEMAAEAKKFPGRIA